MRDHADNVHRVWPVRAGLLILVCGPPLKAVQVGLAVSPFLVAFGLAVSLRPLGLLGRVAGHDVGPSR
jgi:hypothetical protein